MAEPVEVVVQLPGALRTAAGADEIRVAAATVADALDALIAVHPKLRRHIFADSGELRGYVNIFVNEAEIRTLASGQRTRLEPGDTITILPSIAGG